MVGQQPLLKPGESFEYTSGCRLRTPTGTMQGSYFCVAEDGERFDVEIPAFVLDDGSQPRAALSSPGRRRAVLQRLQAISRYSARRGKRS